MNTTYLQELDKRLGAKVKMGNYRNRKWTTVVIHRPDGGHGDAVEELAKFRSAGDAWAWAELTAQRLLTTITLVIHG